MYPVMMKQQVYLFKNKETIRQCLWKVGLSLIRLRRWDLVNIKMKIFHMLIFTACEKFINVVHEGFKELLLKTNNNAK